MAPNLHGDSCFIFHASTQSLAKSCICLHGLSILYLGLLLLATGLSSRPVLVCSGCYNKLHFIDSWFIRNRSVLLTALEAVKSKLRCPQIRCLVAARFLGHRWLSLCCVSHSHGRRARRLSGGLEGDLHSVSRVLHPGRHWLIRKHFGDNLSPAAKLPKFPSVSHLLTGCGPEVSHAGSTSTSVTHQPVSPMREKTLAGQVLVLFLICVIKATDSICCYNCATLNIIILFLESFMLLNFCWITSLLGYMRPVP